MSLDFTEDQSTLVQVMAWCHQETSHYLKQCWPRSLTPHGVTRPQWVNNHWPTSMSPKHISGGQCINLVSHRWFFCAMVVTNWSPLVKIIFSIFYYKKINDILLLLVSRLIFHQLFMSCDQFQSMREGVTTYVMCSVIGWDYFYMTWISRYKMGPGACFKNNMMTSSNGNIFHITGHLCGEFNGCRWIPRTKASDAELWGFLWSAPE